MQDFKDRLSALRKNLGLTQSEMAERIGVRGNYISLLEGGKKDPSDSLVKHVELLEEAFRVGLVRSSRPSISAPLADAVGKKMLEASRNAAQAAASLKLSAPPGGKEEVRMISVVGWAHAGDAASYEQLPESWVTRVPTECRDERAFGVRLEGDSMEPIFKDGDLLVVMPSEEAYSGCFVVARFANDGVVFRRLETAGDRIRLVPLNERYPVTDHAKEEFSWMYPVWGRWTQLWKR